MSEGCCKPGEYLQYHCNNVPGSPSMEDTKIGMSRITAGINERGVCCSTIYSLLAGYIGSPGYMDKCGQALGIIMAP